MARLVGILAFDDMEVLDYAGPYEVFNVAGEISRGAFQVVSIGVTDRPRGRGGFVVVPDHGLTDAPDVDILIIPGGAGSRALLRDERVLAWVREQAAEVEILASVCTGALVLAAAGLLEDLAATTHHGAYDLLAALSPTTEVVRGERFVRSSDLIRTSAGVSAGIDLSLAMVRKLAGDDLHDLVVEEMEWMW